MSNQEQDIELIEKFFDDELTGTQSESFRKRLEQDDDFNRLFQREKLLINGIKFNAIESNLHYLKDLETKLQHKKQGFAYKWPLAIAAAVALFVVAYVTLFNTSDPSDKLFEAYYKPYPNVFEPTVRGDNAANARTQAFQAYDQGNYAAAAAGFEQLLAEKKEPGVLLLLGNSNLMLGKTEEAKNNFTILSNDFDELDIQAKWFLSLCYLKSGEKEEAIRILSELDKTDISYAMKARELLQKVR
ncbi:MAG: hypothetical protein HC859_04440 [Bacteroidia bacterium]|nr:hypothetical protein [Bacteroidia bacterium]